MHSLTTDYPLPKLCLDAMSNRVRIEKCGAVNNYRYASACLSCKKKGCPCCLGFGVHVMEDESLKPYLKGRCFRGHTTTRKDTRNKLVCRTCVKMWRDL